MNRKMLYSAVAASRNVHIPIPIDESDCAETRMKKKEVIKSKVLSDCETLDGWRPISYLLGANIGTDYSIDDNSAGLATVALCDSRSHSGSHSVYFSCPTNLPKLNDVARGRIYAVPTAMLDIPNEDWGGYNRISAWVYPHAPGMKTITIRLQPHNDGEHKVPDLYDREGAHNVTLKPDQWNFIVLEIPYLFRDKVSGLGFEYDMVGHEPDAADKVEFWIDDVHLDEVDADVFEGWMPKADRIVYSHVGYQAGAVKTALISDLSIGTFRVIETESGRVVLEKDVKELTTYTGKFGVLDFSEITAEGNYMLSAGQLLSRVFRIGHDVWESSVWKDLNFFLIERCGYEVPGHHRKCHGDLLLKHGDQAVVADGGWHDAADLAQGLGNTIDGTSALFLMGEALKGSEEYAILRDRIMEEAKWGLDYVLKMRFDGGYRGRYTSSSIWTDGVIGTGDDIFDEAGRSAGTNLRAAYAEALGAAAFKETDPGYAAYALKIAEDDYKYGFEDWEKSDPLERDYERYNFRGGYNMMDTGICSTGALAAASLYAVTGKAQYEKDAARFARRLLTCQQQSFTDWEDPMIGFYYQDRDKDLIWHHLHGSDEQAPSVALRTLCETFPENEDYMLWYEALAFTGRYYKGLMKYSAPYGIIPAGVYHENEREEFGLKKLWTNHLNQFALPYMSYEGMVKNGVPVGSGYYVRRFPVWFDFRGNNNVSLSEAVAVSASAVVRNDPELSQIAQDQQAFIIGANPFGQSLMVGEGHDYIAHYAVQPGQTCGSLTVGMESLDNNDAPYWPQVCTATYKEVWIASATKWIWSNSDIMTEGVVYGVASDKSEIVFTNQKGGVYCVTPDALTGAYCISLPFGVYTMQQGECCRCVKVANHTVRRIDGKLYDLSAETVVKDGKVCVKLTLKGDTAVKVRIRTANSDDLPCCAELIPENGKAEAVLEGTVKDVTKPFVGLAIPDGNRSDALELLEESLR